MFQQSEHKEEQKEHKEEQRWEEEEPRTRGRESYVVSRKRAKKLLHPASSGASGAPSGGASGVASGRAFGGASGVASGGARGQASSMGASYDASDDAASSDDHVDTSASLRRISSNYDEYQERRGALEDAAEGRLTDVSTCLRERYEPWMAMNSPADREDITGDIGQRVGRLKDAQCDMETRMFVTEYDTRVLKQKAAATARKVEELDTAVSGLVAHATVQDRLPVEASNANQEQLRPSSKRRPSSKLKLHARQRAPLEALPKKIKIEFAKKNQNEFAA
jgi:hypothetical protein